MRGGKKPPAKKSEWVSLDGILNFCFPPGEWHPASTGRLAVFGNYGPLADDGNLRCGIRGDHIVSDVELKAMIEEMQREDILNVYIGKQRLQREEQEEILIQADEELHKVPQKSPEEIRKMFRHLKTNKKGQYSFHDLQRVILNERVKRVKKLMEVSKVSFATAEEMKELTGMEVGGVTVFALPGTLPIYVDERIMELDWVILGGGGRDTKIKTTPEVKSKKKGWFN